MRNWKASYACYENNEEKKRVSSSLFVIDFYLIKEEAELICERINEIEIGKRDRDKDK